MTSGKVWDKAREISKLLPERYKITSNYSTLDWENGLMLSITDLNNNYIGEIHILSDLTVVDEDDIIDELIGGNGNV